MENSKSNIFCPNCGANNKIEQNFCRFCAFEFEETARSLEAQLASGQNAAQLKKSETIKIISDFISNGLTVAIAAGILVYILTVLTGTSFPGGRVFFALIVLFAVLESIMFYFRRKNVQGYWDEINRKKSLTQHELKKTETTKLLEEKPFEPIASVTENSTELLFVENKTNKLE